MKKLSLFTSAKKTSIACGILAASLSFGASAFAFSDLKGDPAEAKINALHKNGILNGVTNDTFAPKAKLTFAQGVQFIVSGLQLSPQPSADKDASKASDFFDNINDKAWYAGAFLTAKQNGLSLDKNLNPNHPISRAQFANLLAQALQSKGDFPVTLMYFDIADGAKLPTDVISNLQMLLNTRIISLEKGNTFRPNDAVTRSEAAAWTYDAAELAKRVITPDDSSAAPDYDLDAEVSVVKAAEGINKVSVTVGNLPHPGYGLSIAKIEFGKDMTAVIYYEVTQPDPDKMYPQVISKATAVTYLPEGYKAVAKALSGSSIQVEPLSNK